MTDTAFYNELQADVRELFDEFGFAATYKKAGTSKYSIETGAVTVVGDGTVSIVAILMPVDKSLLREQGTLVRSTDETLMFAATEPDGDVIEQPKPGSKITIDGREHEVITAATLRPGLIPLYHSCVLRG